MASNRNLAFRPRDKVVNCKYLTVLWMVVAFSMVILYNIEPISYSYYYYTTSAVRTPPEGGVMTALSLGRLGNNMLEYATLYSLSRINRCLAFMAPEMKEYLSPCFLVTMPTNWSLDHYAVWRTEPLPHLMVDNRRNVSCHGDFVRLVGYPSDWRYFADDDQSIRKEFTFSADVRAQADAFLKSVGRTNEQTTFVGVHVRRTDYSGYLERQDCALADTRYLVAAMNHFASKFKNVLFVMSSDDPEEASDMLAGSEFAVVIVGKQYSPCTSLAILAQCNHSIITQGTFGFWAAYLAGGETVYFTDYCHKNTELLRKFQGLHLNHWIGISASNL